MLCFTTLLLTKFDIILRFVIENWITDLSADGRFIHVMCYDNTNLVAFIQKNFRVGKKVYITISAFLNVAFRTITKDLKRYQSGRLSLYET